MDPVDLRRELTSEPPHELIEAAGLPISKDANRLVDRMVRVLWAA